MFKLQVIQDDCQAFEGIRSLLKIRNAGEHDAEDLARIYNHYVRHTHITFDLEPVNAENRIAWMSQYGVEGHHRLLVGEATDGSVIGYASSSQFRTKPAYNRSVETTIYLDHEAIGQGHGLALYTALMDELLKTDVHRCYGVIALPNEASLRLHDKLGFSRVGELTEAGFKFDQYWNTCWMEKKLGS